MEIALGDRSGGATTSHTITIPSLQTLLAQVGLHKTFDEYAHAVVEDNILGKGTVGSRKRTLRYLRELYLLRDDAVLFRALCDLWQDAPDGQPLLAGLCALARDPVFRATAAPILDADPGDEITSADLAAAAATTFPDSYSPATTAKIGRNTFSSWEQTGHLTTTNQHTKVRSRPKATPSAVAFALLLGHLEGSTGAALFDTIWARALDHPRAHLIELAKVASQRSLIDFRHAGGVTEVGFSVLLRLPEGRLL